LHLYSYIGIAPQVYRPMTDSSLGRNVDGRSGAATRRSSLTAPPIMGALTQ
jgi:hypothetical protein